MSLLSHISVQLVTGKNMFADRAGCHCAVDEGWAARQGGARFTAMSPTLHAILGSAGCGRRFMAGKI